MHVLSWSKSNVNFTFQGCSQAEIKITINGRFPLLGQLNANTEHFAIFSFSCKYWTPKANGKTTVSINIKNKISKGILVVLLSRRIRETGH